MNLWFYRFIQAFLKLFFSVCNRVEAYGLDKLPSVGGYVIAANHLSYLDPPLLGAVVDKPITFLAKEELFKVWFLGPLIKPLGALPVAGESDFKTLRMMIKALKNGATIMIFPEGTRSKSGEVSDSIKSGVAFLAHAAGIPIVPCFISGTDDAMPRGQRWIKPAKIRVFFGEPVVVTDSNAEKESHYEATSLLVMERIKFLKDSATGRAKGK